MSYCINCNNSTTGIKKYCDPCRTKRKQYFNKRWRLNNPDYNKFYLRKWKAELKEIENEIAKRRAERIKCFVES